MHLSILLELHPFVIWHEPRNVTLSSRVPASKSVLGELLCPRTRSFDQAKKEALRRVCDKVMFPHSSCSSTCIATEISIQGGSFHCFIDFIGCMCQFIDPRSRNCSQTFNYQAVVRRQSVGVGDYVGQKLKTKNRNFDTKKQSC